MRTVALYGNSLILSSVGASLNSRAGVHVIAINPSEPGGVERIRALEPDVIVFDTAAADPDSALILWKEHPNVLLIGIDLTTNRALVMSGRSSQLLTPDDLADVIERRRPGKGSTPLA